jgi:hypothetical protein
MSKLARVLALGAMLVATNLAGITAVAHANDQAAITHDGRRPPTERQVGETWRHRQIAADQHTIAGNPRRPPLERLVGESWRHRVTAVRPAAPSGRPGWLVASLGGLAAAVVLSAGLAVLAVKRAGRRVRVGQAA